jgi:hypothetical protein
MLEIYLAFREDDITRPTLSPTGLPQLELVSAGLSGLRLGIAESSVFSIEKYRLFSA